MDEVRLWDSVRTTLEIASSMNCQLSGDEPDLLAYYNFNQGAAGGNNAGENMLLDRDEKCIPLNGTLYNFALNGAVSNWIAPGAPVSGTCAGTYPNIEISGNGNCIVPGDMTPSVTDNTDFGGFAEPGNDRTFIITNTGTANLVIDSIRITGPDSTWFTVISGPTNPVTPGDTTAITIRFFGYDALGVKNAVVHVYNNDEDETPYNFAVRGISTRLLPVTLISFTGSIVGNTSKLTWRTGTEINNSGFEVWRSADGINDWINVGFVRAANLPNGSTYYFTDRVPMKGINQYRLKQVDMNGTNRLSNIVALNFAGSTMITVYPNPVKDKITLQFNDKALLNTEARILSSTGSVMYRTKLNSYRQEMDLMQMPAGVYFLSLQNGEVYKVIKQ
jgi:hypothetical protein